jgi:hypothetical protein
MTYVASVAVTAQATFGRDSAMFEGLLGFVAQLSLVLWGLVILTVVIRFVGIWIYRRGAARAAHVEAAATSHAMPAIAAGIDVVQPAAGPLPDIVKTDVVRTDRTDAVRTDAVPTDAVRTDVVRTDAITSTTFDALREQAEAPAAVAGSVKVPRHPPRNRRAEPRSAAHVRELAANSTEA